MQSREFYDSLKVVTSFRDVSKPELYTPLPDEWYLAIADVRSSTDAIRLGKYKEVNMAGASIIAALNNFYSNNDLLPYLFGGDGSMLVLPDHGIEEVKGILAFWHSVNKPLKLPTISKCQLVLYP
jgi:GTP cyclohydrolase III